MTINLTNPIFSNADKAREHLEGIRWPNGSICPHCGETEQTGKLEGKSHRPGLYKCYSCNGHFTVTVGTVFEDSKIPLNKWILAAHLMASSKKGYSAHQLHRTIEVSYKTAWFMMHRLREAMKTTFSEPMGGGGGIIEVDETFWGSKPNARKARGGWAHKNVIFSLVERGGKARSFHVPNVTARTLKPILESQMSRDAHMMTDDAGQYANLSTLAAKHGKVAHTRKEYVRGKVHTNTVEGYFSILKRGLIGTYHHVGSQHLQRYVTEFDFRYNHRQKLEITDTQRATILLKNIHGKRLTYA
jgi:transposase-like protein